MKIFGKLSDDGRMKIVGLHGPVKPHQGDLGEPKHGFILKFDASEVINGQFVFARPATTLNPVLACFGGGVNVENDVGLPREHVVILFEELPLVLVQMIVGERKLAKYMSGC